MTGTRSATPNAENLRPDPSTGLLDVEPVSHLRSDHLPDIVDTMLDAAAVFVDAGGPNGACANLVPACDLIRDAAERHRNRPIMALRICRRVVERTRLKESKGDCPREDALVTDFIGAIAGAAGDASASISQGDLMAELPVDARVAVSGAPEGERLAAMYQTKGRHLRILRPVRDKGKAGIAHAERYPRVCGSLIATLLYPLSQSVLRRS